MDIPWDRSKLSRFLPAMVLSDRTLDDTEGQQLAVTLNPATAERWFTGAPHTLSELRSLADARKPLPHFAMPISVRSVVGYDVSTVESDNVVGVLKGSDPILSREYVVISAHLDHVGTSKTVQGDNIYNGAMDNASGIATLLDLATRLRLSNRPLKRSVIFLAVTAEEKGLLGSKYFASRPTVSDGTIVANINTDMFLPLFPMKSVVGLGLEESDLADDLRKAAQSLGVEALPDPEPERNTFIRSDQYNFIRRGVPALALKVGYRLNTPEADLVKRWLAERYHGPSDDLSQPIDRDAAVRFTTLVHALTESVANRATRPVWREDSFFRRFAQSH
jgi:Zn-dependent M28 family amino/carboxypeptidase